MLRGSVSHRSMQRTKRIEHDVVALNGMGNEWGDDEIWTLFTSADCKQIQLIKNVLRSEGLLLRTRKIVRRDRSVVAFPLALSREADGEAVVRSLRDRIGDPSAELRPAPLGTFPETSERSPYQELRKRLEQLLPSVGGDARELLSQIPKRWEKHGDLVVLPSTAFTDPAWERLGARLWRVCCGALGCNRIARDGPVSADGYRTPTARLLWGRDARVVRRDDGIRYTFDVTRSMFSSGNVTEKMRIARFDCRGETVVDLYAGIGYFTLPYLVHAGASTVHACEWNPDAVDALRQNLRLNGVQDRCIIHFGDCREVCPVGVADRVNLGLLPSSEPGWHAACRALKPDRPGWLHVHENVESHPGPRPLREDSTESGARYRPARRDRWQRRVLEVRSTMKSIFVEVCGAERSVECAHVERVKSYGPHVHHLVLDLYCEPTVRG